MLDGSSATVAAGGDTGATEEAPEVPVSDRELLERHLRGDRDAFPELMRTYGNSVFGYLARCGVPAVDREDVFQEVFCKVHRALGRGLPDGPVRPWLFAITVNAARDSFRRKRVRAVVRPDERAGEGAPEETPPDQPDRAAEAREMALWMQDEVAKLSLDQREVLVLCGVQGMTLEEAALAVDAPVNTVKTRLRRARLALAEAMKRRRLVAEREVGR
jgi:RNA polymerase sigma-70 factor (ECF subfamily)